MRFLCIAAILLGEYIIAAYATTDISRQLYGKGLPINSLHSYCPNCGHTLSLFDQLPIFSYYINKRKCRYCNSPIPAVDHLLETGLFLGFITITLLLRISLTAYLSIITLYELTKFICLAIFGMRKTHRVLTMLRSFLMNSIMFMMLGFYFLLYNAVI